MDEINFEDYRDPFKAFNWYLGLENVADFYQHLIQILIRDSLHQKIDPLKYFLNGLSRAKLK